MTLNDTQGYFFCLSQSQPRDRYFLFRDSHLLVRGSKLTWGIKELQLLEQDIQHALLIETVGNARYLAVQLDAEMNIGIDAELVPLRRLLLEVGDREFRHPGVGNQLMSWYQSHQYCGVCGSSTRPHRNERAMYCDNCELSVYPRINPCVIVVVTKGDQLLLARHTRFKSAFYSCLAGFIEVGETPEETVIREVREEAGICVHNIRYMKSQSWPFPSQLMLGFSAEYQSGELVPDGVEIDDIDWFDQDNLPPVPSADISVAGQLIKMCLQQI